MSTKSEQFSNKIRNLTDYQNRVINNTVPLPNGTDIANTLKYFSHTLGNILQNAAEECSRMKPTSTRRRVNMRLANYPSLDYNQFYDTLVALIDIVEKIEFGQLVLGNAIISLFGTTMWFVDPETVDTIPHTVASTLAIFPQDLQQMTVNLLTNTLIPVCLTEVQNVGEENYASMSMVTVVMLVLEHCKNPALHSKVIECIMTYKKDVFKDMMCTIAHGPSKARAHAANLLFNYWPSLAPIRVDPREFAYTAWDYMLCQRKDCLVPKNNAAVKMCMDYGVAGKYSKVPYPPVYFCADCCELVARETRKTMIPVLNPREFVAKECENKNCQSSDKGVTFVCFSPACTSLHSHLPMSYCKSCFAYNHKDVNHTYQEFPEDPWSREKEMQAYFTEAIVSLLKEAQPVDDDLKASGNSDNTHDDRYAHTHDNDVHESKLNLDDPRMLSRFGIWLLVEKCQPSEKTAGEVIGRLLNMLFQWYFYTSKVPDDDVGNCVEKLKTDYVSGWLANVRVNCFDVFVNCLLPQPPQYARVGGHWDTLCSKTSEIDQGLQIIFSLTLYNCVTYEVWDSIMPLWMEAIQRNISYDDLSQLQDILCKLFSTDIPLPFRTDKVFHFISSKFKGPSAAQMLESLQWLQILCELDISLPFDLLVSMFNDGITWMKGPNAKQQGRKRHPSQPSTGSMQSPKADTPEVTVDSPTLLSLQDSVFLDPEEDVNLQCFVVMLDLILRQYDSQSFQFSLGLEHKESKETLSVIMSMLQAPWGGAHCCTTGDENQECTLCDLSALWFQLALLIFETIAGENEVKVADMPEVSEYDFDTKIKRLVQFQKDCPQKDKYTPTVEITEKPKPKKLGQQAKAQSLDLGQVQSISRGGKHQQADAKSLPTSRGNAPRLHKVSEDSFNDDQTVGEDAVFVHLQEQSVWDTSYGEVHFKMSEIPLPLQILAALVKELPKHDDSVVLHYLTSCIRIACLNEQSLRGATKDNITFLVYAQEQLLIPNMWRLMQGELSHLVSLMIPIIHHCVALPCGADALWRVVDSEVKSEDWQTRFRGVESIGAFLRFADQKAIATNSVIMSTLAHIFSSLIGCAEDICPAVATRTVVMLETIPANALKVLIHCLEFQWDSVLEDRALILSRLHQLKHYLPAPSIFTWEFFMNRLDTLSVEAQVDMDQNREFPFPVDFSRSRTVSGEKTEKPNQTKLHRAMIIRTQSDTPQSKLRHQMMPSTSSSTKRFYPRSESAPTNLWAFRRKGGVFRSSERSTYSNQSSPDNVLSLGSLAEEVFEDGYLGFVEEEQVPLTTESQQTNPVDLAFIDKETVHQLVTLLMRFMAESTEDDQHGSSKAMKTVLRHLYALLGFSKTEKLFKIAPHQLRESSVFNAFIAGIAKVMDYNIKLGTKILPLVVELLKYCPSPQKTPHHRQHQDYTLFFLEPHCRQSWLMTILVILYKYDIDSADLKSTLEVLITICINTIEGHVHICKPKLPEPPQPEDIWGATNDDPPKSDSPGIGFDSNSSKGFTPGGTPLHTSTPNKESVGNSGGQTVCKMLYLSDNSSASRVVSSNVVSTIVEEEETGETVEMLEPIAEASLETATAKVMFVEKEEDLVVTCKPLVIEEEPVIEKQITDPSSEEKQKIPYTVRNRRKRKKPIVNIATTGTPDAHRKGSNQRSRGKRFYKRSETLRGSERRSSVHSAVRRYNEDKNIMALNRCSDCNAILEEYDEDTISLAIVVLATYIHKDLDFAAPFLLEVLQVVARVASATFYPWQNEIIGSPPGHVCSVAKQFLRCICHQLAPNGVFVTLFLSKIEDHTFLKTLALALDDFGELSAMDAVHRLLEGLNRRTNLPPLRIQRAVLNLADYMEELPLESVGAWANLMVHFDIFFKKLITVLPENCDVSPLFRIMLVLLKCPAVKNLTALLDSFSKIISFTIQKARFKIRQLMELCSLAYRTFTKDRERLSLSRCVVVELNNALKFKISIPDANLIELVQFVCIDAGGRISETFFDENEMKQLQASWCSTGVLECMRSYMNDCIEFIGDLHTLAKVKSNMRGGSQNLNEDTLGSQLKAGVAQIIALEFTRTSHRDNRTVNRYLPWLYHPPSTMQQGPKEFVDSIAHVRLLSWLLLGSLTHSAMCPTFSYSNTNSITSLPISLDASSHIAEHVQVILACFAEQSSTSILHMSSLTHAFILCQLWTMYCEQFAMMSYPHSEQHNTAILAIMDFWGRVTPGVLQLLSHSKVLAERVNMHFLSLMEALLECHSSALPKLLPMWSPILFSYHSKLPGSTQVRLQTILNNPPPSLTKGEVNNFNCNIRISWLKGLQFKMGQIEVQWSNASQYLAV
ncbi:protein unc-79 homolog isoform X2 [Antedon mediterranea]|uniref:protein unc-79 homolog isoform X2 n=1 Tax=Antedon mediterranea TaxID=105859 RepID=UPI003AF665D7